MVTYTCDEVEHQLRQLKEFSSRLGDSMERTADELRTQGLSPSAQLISDLQTYRDGFFKMRSWLQGHSMPSEVAANATPNTLNDLETGLATQLARTRAVELIDRVGAMSHAEGDQHYVVSVCQQACEIARTDIFSGGPKAEETVAALNQGQHPLAVLWTLITRGDTLEDTEWTDLLERCAKDLGREVATTVARRKLVIAKHS